MGLELRGDGKTVPRILQRVGRADVTGAASAAGTPPDAWH